MGQWQQLHLRDAQRTSFLRGRNVSDKRDGHVVLVALHGSSVFKDVNGVVIADYLTINNGAISADNMAGLALNAVVVDAAQLANAQCAV